MVPLDPFSDSLHDMVRDALRVHDLGSVRGGYADLVGQDLPGNPAIVNWHLAVEGQQLFKIEPLK